MRGHSKVYKNSSAGQCMSSDDLDAGRGQVSGERPATLDAALTRSPASMAPPDRDEFLPPIQGAI